jgi:hypothetical protein
MSARAPMAVPRAARAWAGRVAWCLAGVFLLFGAAVARVLFDGRSDLAASDAAWAAGDVIGATVHARAAARAYVPFAPHVGRAYLRLRTIAQSSEARGDVETAIFAWRAIRAAAIGSRSLFTSHDRQREVADAAIARLSAPPASVAPFRRAGAEAPFPYIAAHGDEVPPRPLWGVLLLVGAALWAYAGFRLTSRASLVWNVEGKLPIAMAMAGLLVWWVALFMA